MINIAQINFFALKGIAMVKELLWNCYGKSNSIAIPFERKELLWNCYGKC